MEFREVMKQWRRFCKSHSNCGECEFDGKGICSEAHLTDIPYADIELRIMAWAAEHPEPKYPTWAEWLIEQGIYVGTFIKDKPRSRDRIVDLRVTDKVYQPIDADLAQKLGIEPKEG